MVSSVEKKLFLKEAKILKSVIGHENVVKILGFSYFDCGILLEFCEFSFKELGIEVDPVSDLKAFLKKCDRLFDFKGFQHLQYYLAFDISSGLEFLHRNDIVHRDLKPENVLVSNNHYVNSDKDDVRTQLWWQTKPIRAVLTDFGESRSKFIQTKSMLTTATSGIFRGTPVYMAPEATVVNGPKANIEDLKRMDIWSLSMVFFDLLNPNADYPYNEEMKDITESSDKIEMLRQFHARKQLPNHLTKYQVQQDGVWKPLRTLFSKCALFAKTNRPSAKKILQDLTNQYVNVQPLSISQSSITQMINEEAFELGQQSTHSVQRTDNACSFLALLIADKIMQKSINQSQLQEVTTDIILNFPVEVNSRRASKKMYSVDEAYSILREVGACASYDFSMPTYSTCASSVMIAQQELQMALGEILQNSVFPMCALYTCPPYTILICRPVNGELTVVDTHIVSDEFGGNNTGAIVTPLHSESAISELCQWLFKRMNVTGEILQELAIIRPSVNGN